MRFPWSRPKSQLSDADVPADWASSGVWRGWESPRNYVAGEDSYQPALRALATTRTPDGCCQPVTVTLIRERTNRYDANAWRAEVDGRCVGYLRRHLAEQIAGPLDRAGCTSFVVPGVLRGGSKRARSIGCHIWLDRRLAPGPSISLPSDDEYVVAWPPREA